MAFYVVYTGSKRRETKHLDRLDLGALATVVEPFAGSAAVARSLPHLRAVINDADPSLMAFYDRVAASGFEPLKAAIREALESEESWQGKRKEVARRLRAGEVLSPELYVIRNESRNQYARTVEYARRALAPKLAADFSATDAWVRAAERSCGDWLEVAKRYAGDPTALIFLDPPYFSSYNAEYYGHQQQGIPGAENKDFTLVFVQIRDLLRDAAAAVVLIVNDCAILRELLGPWVRDTYAKTYGSGTKAAHMLVSNRPLKEA